jgi:hypothetical protein
MLALELEDDVILLHSCQKKQKTRMTMNTTTDRRRSFSWKITRTTMNNNVAYHRYLHLLWNLKKMTSYTCFPLS